MLGGETAGLKRSHIDSSAPLGNRRCRFRGRADRRLAIEAKAYLCTADDASGLHCGRSASLIVWAYWPDLTVIVRHDGK
jgi:hypothetical protein